MAKIKPQALLNQSKKKKGPNRISVATVMFCSVMIALILLSLVATYRYWSQRSKDQTGREMTTIEDTNGVVNLKKHDLPSHADINTSKGLITVELFKESSPEAVDKFLDLCQKGHFNGMPFHHVIKNYMIQAGNSPGIVPIEDWTAKGKLRGRLFTSPKHEAFMLGTLKSEESFKGFELLVTTAPFPDMKDQLIVFGRVLKGEDVVQEIEEVDTDEHYQPRSPIEIISVKLKSEA